MANDSPQVLPLVEVTGRRTDPDELRLLVNGKLYRGWIDVRVTRGIERCPSDFEVSLTERYPNLPEVVIFKPGDACQVYLGFDLVITGYIDRFLPSIQPEEHRVVISGRGKCADLVDCSAIWPSCVIKSATVLGIAERLAAPYGIKATVEPGQDTGDAIPQLGFGLGESAFGIIETACRYRALLAYELPTGDLHLSRISTRRAASGFREGVNVQRAEAMFSMDQRYSEYVSFLVGNDVFGDLGEGGNLLTAVKDEQVTRFRNRYVPAEGPPTTPYGDRIVRATWERNRRFGRGFAVRLQTDGWRDRERQLYEPNTLVDVDLPTLKLTGQTWLVSEVTYRCSEHEGTTAELTLMPPEAFSVQPPSWPQWSDVKPGQGVRP